MRCFIALHGVGKSTYSLKIASKINGKIYDVIARDAITISRDKNTASKLSATIRRNSTTQGEAFTPEWGDEVQFTLDEDHNQFAGHIRYTKKEGQWCEIIAYDQIWFMANNTIDYVYQDKTAKDVLLDLCDTYGVKVLDPDELEETKFVIPFRSEENVSLLDIMTKAIEETYNNTGIHYYLWDDFGNIRLNSDEWLAGENWTIVAPGFIEGYAITEERENFKTQIHVKQKTKKTKEEDSQTLVFTADNSELEDKYGVLNDMVELPDGVEDAQSYADQLLKSHEHEPLKLSISRCQGDITVRGGTPIFLDFFSNDRLENVRGWFSVENVVHTIQKAHHTMDLEVTEIINLTDWNNPYQAITGEKGLVTDFSDAEYYGGLPR